MCPMNSSTSFMFNLHLLGARSDPNVPARGNPSIGSLPLLTHPAILLEFFWQKMPSKCVSWIVLQVSCSTRYYKGPEVAQICRRAKIPSWDPDLYWPPLPTLSNSIGSKCLLNIDLAKPWPTTHQHMHQHTQQLDFKWFIVLIILARRLYICNQYLIIGKSLYFF